VVVPGRSLRLEHRQISDPEASARLLRVVLEEGRYALASAMIRRRHMELPFVELHSETRIMDSARSFSPLTQALIRLFMLGEGISVAELESTLSREMTSDLIAGGLLIVSDASVRARWLIATYLNRYFLASPPLTIRPYSRREGIVYIGAESYWMARFVASSGPSDSVLDLGTGTGLLACMADARQALGVEVDPAAAELATFNVMLNGLEDKVAIQIGDLYDGVRGRKFDLIAANPPFMPAPEGTHLPTCGDGGYLGDDVLKRVLIGLDRHLGPAGQALVYAEAFGDFEEPRIVRWLRESDLGALKFSVFVRSTQSLEAASLGLTLLWQETGASEDAAWAAWKYLAGELDASYHHAFLIIANRGNSGVSVHHPYRV
jgi:SAM-dependent methyltransferase